MANRNIANWRRTLSGERADQVDPGRDHGKSAGSVQHAGDHVQGSAGRQDSVRDRRFPGVRANERTHVRDTTIAQGTRPRLEGASTRAKSVLDSDGL